MLRSLDLFSGVGGITHALRGLATPVMYCEKDPDCHVVLKKLMAQGRIPKAPLHDDVAKLTARSLPAKPDMIVAGFPCFPAGTRVNTDAGYVPIEQVTGERLLLTHAGRYRAIENLQRKLLPAGQPMYSVDVAGLRDPIRCTEEHPFYARARVGEGVYSDPEFVDARDLTGDHVVGLPIDRVSEGTEYAADLCELCKREPTAFIHGDHVWSPVRRVDHEPTAEDQWVYNFQVAEDNSYCVEGVAVHNCIGFSSSGKREGLDQPGSRLFVHVMRLAKDIRPPLMFFENVDAILGNDDITKIVGAIRRLGYDMYWVVMPAYTVGAPQKRGRWFCLCVRRGVTGVRVKPSEPFARFNWKVEPRVRMVPAATPDVRRRMRMLGNGVVPDCVRAAFLSLFTGCTVPIPRLLAASARGSPDLVLSPPRPLEAVTSGRDKAFACVLSDGLHRIAPPPGMLPAPKLKLVLDPKAFRAPKPPSAGATSGFITEPKPITMWSTIRAGNGAYAMNCLTNRGSHDLATQLRYERRTPSGQRGGVTNPEWAEWLQGHPRGWTASS